jgi:two-component system CheB/CheR fusion protein
VAESIIITFVEISRLKNEEKHVFEAKRRLDYALSTGERVWWEYRIPTGHVTYSDSKVMLLGYQPDEWQALYPIKRKNGTYVLHHDREKVVMRDEAGALFKMMGLTHDVSSIKEFIHQ